MQLSDRFTGIFCCCATTQACPRCSSFFYGAAGLYAVPSLKTRLIYLLVLVVQYAVVRQAASNYGIRFVTTVLACWVAKERPGGAKTPAKRASSKDGSVFCETPTKLRGLDEPVVIGRHTPRLRKKECRTCGNDPYRPRLPGFIGTREHHCDYHCYQKVPYLFFQ